MERVVIFIYKFPIYLKIRLELSEFKNSVKSTSIFVA